MSKDKAPRRNACAYLGHMPNDGCCRGGTARFWCRIRNLLARRITMRISALASGDWRLCLTRTSIEDPREVSQPEATTEQWHGLVEVPSIYQ
jgi:hypothetical protein